MYVKLKKALYGTLKAALLFWQDLTKILKEDGFEINPYDWCVANKMVNGKQITVVWHVDDLKISHVDEQVVDETVRMLNNKYGKHKPLTVNRGKIHDYLGMKLDYSQAGKVIVDMKSYIDEILNECPEDMKGVVKTPAADHLFKTNERDPQHLNAQESEWFHHIVAKTLFLAKRGRPDIQTSVAFLCTRVKKPDMDDYKSWDG